MKEVRDKHLGRSQAVVFVHGLGGNIRTWGSFGDLVTRDPDLANHVDVLYYCYPTYLLPIPFLHKTPRIQTLADGLLTFLHTRCSNYELVHLVCHSLGGLVARQGVLKKVNEASPRKPQVETLTLFAVPCNGAALASIGKYLSPFNLQVRQICRSSDFIENLNENWSRSTVNKKVRVKYVVGGLDNVVSPESAKSYYGNDNVETVIDKDHKSIVKPLDFDDQSFIILKQLLLAHNPLVRSYIEPKETLKLIDQANSEYAHGEFHAAERSLKLALERIPTSGWITRELGKVYFAQRAFDKVLELIDRWPKSPQIEDPDIACMRAEYLIRKDELKDAIEVLTQVVPRSTYNLEYLTGNAYLLAGADNPLNLAFSRKHFEAATTIDPDCWWARTNLVYVLQILSNREHLTGAIERDLTYHKNAAWQSLQKELNKNPFLFSARLYRLALAAAFNDRILFERIAAEDIDYFSAKKLHVNYIFPSSLLARIKLLYEKDEEAIKYYQNGLIRWLTSI